MYFVTELLQGRQRNKLISTILTITSFQLTALLDKHVKYEHYF